MPCFEIEAQMEKSFFRVVEACRWMAKCLKRTLILQFS
jgi:hypothetical protein